MIRQVDEEKHIAYLSLGSNLGDKLCNLQNASKEIAERIGKISAISSVVETKPWGYQSPNLFLNMAICVETIIDPFQLLTITQCIEKEMKRTKKTSETYQDRLIDIDLILYDDLILNHPQLILPHPLFHERIFVLEPLFEIAPEVIHPVLRKTTKELLKYFRSSNLQ